VPGKLEGKVVSITDEGNLVTDISSEQLAGVPRDDQVVIRCDEHETVGIHSADHGEPDFTFLAILGPSGHLELSIVGVSASGMLGIREGESVLIKW
jgi:S-adenosylmethionine hydrolase